MSKTSTDAKVSSLTLSFFGLPAIAYGYLFCLVTLYFMRFATDVLLIAPAVMGTIFGISRLWDAVSDPLVGYWSDRTKHPKLGGAAHGLRLALFLPRLPISCYLTR